MHEIKNLVNRVLASKELAVNSVEWFIFTFVLATTAYATTFVSMIEPHLSGRYLNSYLGILAEIQEIGSITSLCRWLNY